MKPKKKKSPPRTKKRRSTERSMDLDDSENELRLSIGLDSVNQKPVEVKLIEKVTIKVPLVGSAQIPWVTDHIINNSLDFYQVYQRKEFSNSQELINHNLKEKPDPLFKQPPKKNIRVPVVGSQIVDNSLAGSPKIATPTRGMRRKSTLLYNDASPSKLQVESPLGTLGVLSKQAESPLGVLSVLSPTKSIAISSNV